MSKRVLCKDCHWFRELRQVGPLFPTLISEMVSYHCWADAYVHVHPVTGVKTPGDCMTLNANCDCEEFRTP